MPANSWEDEWSRSLRTAEDLREYGLIGDEDLSRYRPVLDKYRFTLPRYYASLIDKNDPGCPIRLQAIPDPRELNDPAEFLADPLKDLDHRPTPRLTHRYRNRALIHLTPNCSMYCRYCFRKTLLNELSPELFAGGLEQPLAYLAAHPEIEEVIFSGGDPFMVSDTALKVVLRRLGELPGLKRVRFHTRVPVTFPQRITPELARALEGAPWPLAVVTHFNHPKEVTREAQTAVGRLGATLLNQSVLLRGVNDDSRILAELSEKLYAAGILPYYLHHPDRARGTGHFDIGFDEGLKIERELRASLPGYLVPRYVIDVPGNDSKLSVSEFVRR